MSCSGQPLTTIQFFNNSLNVEHGDLPFILSWNICEHFILLCELVIILYNEIHLKKIIFIRLQHLAWKGITNNTFLFNNEPYPDKKPNNQSMVNVLMNQ